MQTNHLLTCAILQVNNNQKSDYFDNMAPFVAETIRVSKEDIVSANNVKRDLLDNFKLDIPVQVINTIIKKKLKTKNYVFERERVLYANRERLETIKFSNRQEKIHEKHEKLVKEIIDYANLVHKVDWSSQKAEEVLEKFIKNNSVNLLINHYDNNKGKIKLNHPIEQKGSIIISAFIRDKIQEESIGYKYLIDVVKGMALSNVFNITTPDNILMKFKNTDVFFDTSFIVRALGLNGPAQKEPCVELLSMLKACGAKLKVFRHNIDEVTGILEFTKHNLNKSMHDPHGTFQYLISEGFDDLEIEKLIYNIEEEISTKLDIEITDKITYNDNDFAFPEDELESLLKSQVGYKHNTDQAVYNDVQSVLSIMRIRDGIRTSHIEDSRAVFVTTNFSFAKAIGDYFSTEDHKKSISPILHDSIITNLVWLKNPSKAPDLPFKKMIADCYAALQPPEYLWDRYIEYTNLLKENDSISEEDLVLLKYSPTASYLLVSKTLGKEDDLTIGTVQEILKEVQKRKQKEHIKEINTLNKEKKSLSIELESAKKQIASSTVNQQNRIDTNAEKQASIITNSLIGLIISLVLFYFLFIDIANGYNINNFIKIMLTIFPIVILQVLSLFGVYIEVKTIKKYFKRIIKKRLQNKYFTN